MRAERLTPMLLVATLVVAGAAAAAGYGLTAPKQYDATAKLLVAPVSASDQTFAGVDVLRDASGRHTAAQSAAVLVETPEVAQAVDVQLGLGRSTGSLLDHVHARVDDGSDVVDVSAEDSSAGGAARLANAFVDALIARRTATFQSELSGAIHRDAQLLASRSVGPQAVELARRLAVLRGFVGQPDPTLRRVSTAVAPQSASWPGWAGLILIGAGAGLAAGVLASLALLLWRGRGSWRLREPAYDRPVSSHASDDRAVQALVDRLEQRLAKRESALAARERDLQQRIDELRALESRTAPSPGDDSELAGRERALAERERQLEERVAAVTRRELAVARAAAKPQPRPEPAASPPPAPAEARTNGAFNLGVLERLVAEGGGEHPDRIEEWQSYLFFLRDYAGAGGELPRSFDSLVEETFRPLLN